MLRKNVSFLGQTLQFCWSSFAPCICRPTFIGSYFCILLVTLARTVTKEVFWSGRIWLWVTFLLIYTWICKSDIQKWQIFSLTLKNSINGKRKKRRRKRMIRRAGADKSTIPWLATLQRAPLYDMAFHVSRVKSPWITFPPKQYVPENLC